MSGEPIVPFKGVATVPPPPSLLDAITKEVKRTAGDLPAGSRGGLVTVVTTTGVNLAVVAKVNDHIDVKAFIGKSWGQPVVGGGAVVVHF